MAIEIAEFTQKDAKFDDGRVPKYRAIFDIYPGMGRAPEYRI